MCLYRVTNDTHLMRKRTGWKLVRVRRNGPSRAPGVYSGCRNTTLKLNEWNKARGDYGINSEAGAIYEAGFHCHTSMEDAVRAMPGWHREGYLKLIRVRVKGVKTAGIGDGRRNGMGVPQIVCQSIKIDPTYPGNRELFGHHLKG